MNSGTQHRTQAPLWIACRRQTRSVNDGEVFCPKGDVVPWQSCLECRLLEAVDDDRQLGCGELETSPPPGSGQHTIEPVRWPELIIELL